GTFVYSNEGLVKKTISANVEGSIQHMIIYEDKQGHHDDLYPPHAYVELSNIIPSSAIMKIGALRKASKIDNSKYSLPKIQVPVGIKQEPEEIREISNDNYHNQFKDNQFKEVENQKIIFTLPSNPFNTIPFQSIQSFSDKTDVYSP
ncbi:4743_t:CDS:2, partial [Scutellospora calospora]